MNLNYVILVFKWAIPGLFLFIFGLLNISAIYITNKRETIMKVSGAEIRTHDFPKLLGPGFIVLIKVAILSVMFHLRNLVCSFTSLQVSKRADYFSILDQQY